MHTSFNKISVRERENAPRYYYKVSHKVTCVQRLQAAVRSVLAFLFTQIGVCALVATYMVMGAFLFSHLEADSSMEHAIWAVKLREGKGGTFEKGMSMRPMKYLPYWITP